MDMGKAQLRLVVDNDPRLEAEAEAQALEAGRRPGRWVGDGPWVEWVEDPKPKRARFRSGRLGLWRARVLYWYWMARFNLRRLANVFFGGVPPEHYGVERPSLSVRDGLDGLRGGWAGLRRGLDLIALVLLAPVRAGVAVVEFLAWLVRGFFRLVGALILAGVGVGVLLVAGWVLYSAVVAA